MLEHEHRQAGRPGGQGESIVVGRLLGVGRSDYELAVAMGTAGFQK